MNANLLIFSYDCVKRNPSPALSDNRFEDKFRYDESGVPRIWKPSDDIDGIFKSAREQVSPPQAPVIDV